MNFSLRCGLAILVLFSGLTLLATDAAAKSRRGHVNKYAAFVMDSDSGDVLFSRYADSKRYPASLTKMMTLYLLFEELEAGRLTLSSEFTVSARAAAQPASKLGLKVGDKISVEDAIKAIVVNSANDVAVVIAEGLSGSEWRFARKMTAEARTLGMRHTQYRNASGLPNSRQTTTARDLAILSQRLIQDFPQYFYFFDTLSFTWNARTYQTHNRVVKTFDGADGLKTGYTSRSGFNLATTAQRDGVRLIGIVLGGRSVRTRDNHMKKILRKAFSDIKAKPTLIAALHRETPTPRMKPTLIAALAAQNSAPTIAGNEAMRGEIKIAAASLGPTAGDGISALIAAADSDDFNEFERVKLSAVDDPVGEGDIADDMLWSVQIGAFTTKSMAQRELETAAIAAELSDRSRIVSPTTREDGATLYRARFTNLNEDDAVAACNQIKAAHLACFAMSEAKAR